MRTQSFGNSFFELNMLYGAIMALSLASCSQREHVQETNLWFGYQDNGDKPGLALVIMRNEAEITGVALFLNPDTPLDLAQGFRCPMGHATQVGNQFVFQFPLPSQENAVWKIRFRHKLSGGNDTAELNQESSGEPTIISLFKLNSREGPSEK